jgi:anti-sigma regulatory factor (Ser/Thr protein kinase)
VLLEITDVTRSDDVHQVVERIQSRAQGILVHELHLDPQATMRFAMTLSEVCQNFIEHAGQGGWVAVQAYRYRRRLGRRVVVIAVCDAGVGFRRSLESSPGWKPKDRWDDAMALEDALIRGVSRYRDPGRGQGLAGVRRFVGKWDGKLAIRSGTARIAIVPDWDDAVPLQEGMPHFPGAQVQITIPERVTPG